MVDNPVSIFISYSRQDEAYRQELVSYLKPLQRSGLISSWHDGCILPGEAWEPQIKANLEQAQIILLLISKDFLASDYCYNVELTQAIARHQAGSCCVIPVILRSCLWTQEDIGGLRLSDLQALPQNAKPVSQWSDPDDAFTNVAEGLLKTIRQFREPEEQVKPSANWDCPPAAASQQSPQVEDNFSLPRLLKRPRALASNMPISRQQFLLWGLGGLGLVAGVRLGRSLEAILSLPARNSDAGTNTGWDIDADNTGDLRRSNTSGTADKASVGSNTKQAAVDYSRLENFLQAERWEEADQETLELMLQVANRPEAGYLTADDLAAFPCEVLKVIDELWVELSNGHFGFSIQQGVYTRRCEGSLDDYDQETYLCFVDAVGWQRVWESDARDSQVTYSLGWVPEGHLPWKVHCPSEYCDGSLDELRRFAALMTRLTCFA